MITAKPQTRKPWQTAYGAAQNALCIVFQKQPVLVGRMAVIEVVSFDSLGGVTRHGESEAAGRGTAHEVHPVGNTGTTYSATTKPASRVTPFKNGVSSRG